MSEKVLSDEIIAFFMQMPVFDRINREELKVVARQMSVITLEEGEILFRGICRIRNWHGGDDRY